MKRAFILTITSLLLSSFLFSQKKYPSLLWEISGNGLKEKSYLYGTMHVSEKIAFNLSDIFFEKLYSVKQVALESDPNLWLDDLRDEKYDYYYRFPSDDYYGSQAYFKYTSLYLTPIQTRIYEGALQTGDYVTDGILYRRYGGRMQNFQEDTYLDMFIYRSAKKLNKKFYGLEDIKESRKNMEKAYQYDSGDYDDQKTKRSWAKKLLKGQPVRVVMSEAYRKQDLDLIDSLQKAYYTPKNLEYSLYIRNENMVKAMDSLMKKGSLFSAVGAAHLAGKKGIIEKLRSRGYIVKPLTGPYTEKGKKQKENIDNLIYGRSLSLQNNYDGFSIKSPDKFFDFSTKQATYLVSMDIPNGAFLSLYKFNHFEFLNKPFYRSSVQSIDSLLYQNIPGKILTKKHITKNGYPGIEITSRKDNDEYLNTQIFLTPLETYIFSLNGTKNYETRYKDAIFSSLKLKNYSGSFSNFTPKSGGYTVNLPDYRISTDSLDAPFVVTAYDKNTDSYYFITTQVMDVISPEKEEYELQRIPYEFARNLNIKNIETELIKDSVPYSESNAPLNNKTLYLKTIINGADYNLIGIVTNNQAIQTRFFNSFRLNDFISCEKPEKYENKTAGYSLNLPFKPKSTEDKDALIDSAASPASPAYDPDYSSINTDVSSYYKLENGQKISISYYIPDLESDSLQTEEIIKDFVKTKYESDSCMTKKIRFIQSGLSGNQYPYSDYRMENENNSSQAYKLRYYYQNEKIYEIKYLINKHREYINPSAEEAFNNITFFKPETGKTDKVEEETEENNLDEEVLGTESDEISEEVEAPDSKDLDYHNDEYKIEQDSIIWTAIDKKNQPILNKMKVISPDYKKVENFMLASKPDSLNTEILSTAIQVLDFHDKTKAGFYEKLYPKFKNDGDSQLNILTKIVEIDSIKGIKKWLSLMKEELPIPSSSMEVYNILSSSSYASKNSENYILPEILKYVAVNEYHTPIMGYLSDLMSEDKLKAGHIKKYKKYFLNEAKNDFKRTLINPEYSDSDYYYSDEGYYPGSSNNLKNYLDLLSIIDDSDYHQLVAEIRNTQKPELLTMLAELKKPVELSQTEYISLTKESIPSKELNKAYKDKFGKDIFDPEKDLTVDMARKTLLSNSNYNYSYEGSSKDSLTLKEEKTLVYDTKKYKVFYFTITKNKSSEDADSVSKKEKNKKAEKEEYNGTNLAVIAFDLTKEKDEEENTCSDYYNDYNYDYSSGYDYDNNYSDSSSLVKIVYLSTSLSYYDEEDWKELDENFVDFLKSKGHPRASEKFSEQYRYDDYHYY